jgi:hypothetical protein
VAAIGSPAPLKDATYRDGPLKHDASHFRAPFKNCFGSERGAVCRRDGRFRDGSSGLSQDDDYGEASMKYRETPGKPTREDFAEAQRRLFPGMPLIGRPGWRYPTLDESRRLQALAEAIMEERLADQDDEPEPEGPDRV